MVLLALPGPTALEHLRSNKFVRWGPNLETEDRPMKPEWAAERLNQQIFEAGFAPSFKMRRSYLVYAAGSCFARNIEKNLLKSGMNLLFNPDEILSRPEFFLERTDLRENFLTRYNTPTILSDILALERPDIDDRLIYEIAPGKFVDMRLGAYPPTDRETILERRRFIKEKSARVGECACVILTLGLSETWYDKEAEEYLNFTPDLRFLNSHQDRFELHVLDYEQHVSMLTQAITILRNRGVKNIIITISPIPLISTFTSDDVVIANEYSKSVLRAAAGAICLKLGVDYFPSFEMVKYSDRKFAWRRDARHVTDPMVGRITSLFMRAYLE
jgi:hypothetical protein